MRVLRAYCSCVRRKPARRTFAAPSQTGELGAAPVVRLRPGVKPRIGGLASDYKRTRFVRQSPTWFTVV
jgi:hypothetical protein